MRTPRGRIAGLGGKAIITAYAIQQLKILQKKPIIIAILWPLYRHNTCYTRFLCTCSQLTNEKIEYIVVPADQWPARSRRILVSCSFARSSSRCLRAISSCTSSSCLNRSMTFPLTLGPNESVSLTLTEAC